MSVADPTRADAFEIENADAAAGPRLIEARLSDGSLYFTDPQIPTGIALYELAGLQRAQNTIIVSQTGEAASKDSDNNPVTTIQKALDLIPNSADVNNPWFILVAPGVYLENLLWVKDHTYLIGLGPVTIRPAQDQDTVRILEGAFTVPRRLRIQGIRIENSNAGRACIRFSSTQFATATITFTVVPNIGDFVTIAGVQMTAIANGSIPAANEFELGLTEEETAQNLVAALVDPLNGLDSIVYPSSSLNILTLRAFEPGVAGNLFTLSSSVPLIMTPSGANFTGGQDVSTNSTVAFELAEVLDCDLVPTGMNGYQVYAQAVNNIRVKGGNWQDSAVGVTYVEIHEVASFEISDVVMQRAELHYDSAAAEIPNIITSEYKVQRSEITTQLESRLDGVGSLTIEYTKLFDLFLAGTQAFTFRFCNMRNVNTGDTIALTLSQCKRGVLAGIGTETAQETSLKDSLTFNASVQETYNFPLPVPNLNYFVLVEVTSANIPFVPVATKTLANFTIDFPVAFTGDVNFEVRRDI